MAKTRRRYEISITPLLYKPGSDEEFEDDDQGSVSFTLEVKGDQPIESLLLDILMRGLEGSPVAKGYGWSD